MFRHPGLFAVWLFAVRLFAVWLLLSGRWLSGFWLMAVRFFAIRPMAVWLWRWLLAAFSAASSPVRWNLLSTKPRMCRLPRCAVCRSSGNIAHTSGGWFPTSHAPEKLCGAESGSVVYGKRLFPERKPHCGAFGTREGLSPYETMSPSPSTDRTYAAFPYTQNPGSHDGHRDEARHSQALQIVLSKGFIIIRTASSYSASVLGRRSWCQQNRQKTK